jgi:N-acetylmuramoyl-L-alanine amidase
VAYYFSRKGYFSEAGKLLAEDIANGIAEAIGIPALPAMGRNFAVLRETEMTAILVEPAFITGEGMTEMVGSEDFARDVAEAIFTALSQYFAVKGSNKPQ